MKKKDFQKGAISLFLTIILVPSIVVSSIFVDLSRVKLSQSVATSAADLSLNSLMTYFDTDLKDFYGMVVSCQNIEQFYAEAEQYFLSALYSQGLNADDIDSLLALYKSLVEKGEVHDLLLMDVQTESGQIVSAVPNASLGNSSLIMKDQIVEFMKYRAPIEITTGIIDRLKKNNVSKVLSDADKNEELVESKQQYAEDEADLLEAAFYTYKYIKEYVNTKATLIKIKEISQRLETYRGLYKEINAYMVSNLVNTKDLSTFKRPTYSLTAYSSSYSYKSSSVYSRKVTEEDEEGNETTYYYIDGSDMEDIFEDVEDAIDDFNTKKNAVVTALGDLLSKTTGQTSSHANAIQWWVRANKAINNGSNSPIAKFKTSAQKMLKMYDKLLVAEDCDEGNNLPADWKQTCTDLKNQVSRLQSKYLTSGKVDNSDNYLKAVNKLENISSGNINKINANNLYLSNGKSIPATVTEINTKLNADIDTLNSYIEALDTVIDGKTFGQPKSLDKLKSLVTEYKNSFNTWKGNAESLNGVTDLGTADYNEINGIEGDEKDTGQNDGKDRLIEIKESDVTQLKTRLVNIRSQFKDLVKAIKDLKYCGKQLVDIDSYNTLYSAAKGKISDIPLTNGEIATKADTVFNSQFKPSSTGKLFTVNESSDYNPDLSVSKPALYAWMEQKFKNEVENTEKNIKDEQSNMDNKKSEGDSDNAKESQKSKTDERSKKVSTTNIYGGSYTGGDFPSGLDKGAPFALGSSFIGTFGSFVDILTGDTSITSIRDTIYSAEYVMDMFSYNTYENEGLYKLYKEKNGKAPTKNEHLISTELQTTWDNDEKTFTNNKTLTNMRIYEGNNVANGAEVEYVLYGNTNKGSITSAYVDIFTVRYLLNTLSGFQNFWGMSNTTGQFINTLANSIAGATAGVVPAPLTKTVVILLLTALETGKDLDRLSDGLPVEFYKDGDDWWFSMDPETFLNWGTKETAKECENGLFYSDYMYLFLFMGFETSSASEMYLRIGDLIQANMRKYTGSGTYSLKNSHVYFKVDATIRVRPLLLALPIAKNGFSNNPSDKNDWCTFKISEIRGYS